jgi:hypothetical protein
MKSLKKYANEYFGINLFIFVYFLITSFCVSFFIYINFLQFPLFSKRNIIIIIIIIGFLTAVLYFSYRKLFKPTLLKLRKWVLLIIILISLIFSFALVSFYSIKTAPFYFLFPKKDLTIQIDLGEGDSNSQGLYISYLRNEFRDIGFSELNISGKYEFRNNGIYLFPGQTAIINWKGVAGNDLSISFIPLKINQSIKILWGDSKTESFLLQNLNNENNFIHHYQSAINETLVNRLIAFPIIFMILAGIGLNFYGQFPYSSLLLSTWLLTLLIFWPGIIGDVNIIVTNDFFAGIIADWHPVIYTILLGSIIKITSTASSLLIIQIIALSLIIGFGFSYLEKKGCNKKILWLLTFIIAFMPTNFLSIITLTDDIPYSIALLLLTILILEIIFSNGNWLNKTSHWLLLSAVSLTAILFRYNGIPAIGFSLICLLIFIPLQRRIIAKVIGLVIILYFIIDGPIFNLIGVTRMAEGQFDNILLHHISAQINAGTPLNNDQKKYLNSLYPLDGWEYSCCSNSVMWFKPGFNQELFHKNSGLNRTIALDLLLKNPLVEIKHILCASDMIWNVVGKCEIKNPFIDKNHDTIFWTRSYFPEYTENSKIPILVKPLSETILGIENNSILSLFFWRPAIYLYIAILSTMIFYLRRRKKTIFLVLCPLLGQSIFLFFFNRIQNFRYQYCAILIGLFLIGLIFFPNQSIIDEEGSSNI